MLVKREDLNEIMEARGGWIERKKGLVFWRYDASKIVPSNRKIDSEKQRIIVNLKDVHEEDFISVPAFYWVYFDWRFIVKFKDRLRNLLQQYHLEKHLRDCYPLWGTPGSIYPYEYERELSLNLFHILEENYWVEELFDEFQKTEGLEKMVEKWCASRGIELV